MTELEKYELVNAAETFEELIEAVLTVTADDLDSLFPGRNVDMTSKHISDRIKSFTMSAPAVLTRKYGLRQQAMYISYYTTHECH